MPQSCRIVVLISGNGSNLQAIIDAIAANAISGQLVAVISDKPGAYGLERAKQAEIPTAVLEYAPYGDRGKYDHALMNLIDQYQPDLVVLAGFMRILSNDFVNHYLGRMLNIHPSLLPKHKGLHTHRRVLEEGDSEHGATVHFVTPELDSGPVILQDKFAVTCKLSEQELADRVHKIEHQIYPKVIGWFAEGRLSLSHNRVLLDKQAIS